MLKICAPSSALIHINQTPRQKTQQMQSYNIHHARLPLMHANRKELREVYLECDETYASELPSIRKCHAIQLFNGATLRKEVTDIIFC
jgi:hypothetical protein